MAADGTVRAEFSEYVEALIVHYQEGNSTSHTFVKPTQSITREEVNQFKSGVKGVHKLLDSYILQHGDPEKNGLGHAKMKVVWKDGV
eukprot:4782573-Pyramimonas_sp.AAC.1